MPYYDRPDPIALENEISEATQLIKLIESSSATLRASGHLIKLAAEILKLPKANIDKVADSIEDILDDLFSDILQNLQLKVEENECRLERGAL